MSEMTPQSEQRVEPALFKDPRRLEGLADAGVLPASALESVDSGSAAAQSFSKAPSLWFLRAFVALGLAGVAVAVELTRIHVFVHTDPDYHSVCAMSEGINCETVAVSPYSVFVGIPVSVWGILGYVAMTTLALWGSLKVRLHATWPLGLLLLLSASSVMTSAILGFISVTRIDSICLFCTASYVINAALFAITLAAWRQTRVGLGQLLLGDMRALRARPRTAVAAGVMGAVLLWGVFGYYPKYWQAPGWVDLAELPSGIDPDGYHWIGAPNPKLTIIEFSDYQCPHCRAAHKDIRALAAKHPDKVRLIHRHLPLDMGCHPGLDHPFHRYACTFAEAAECAGLQNKFWEMNDALFSIEDTVKAASVDVVELAVRLGLNSAEFKQCLETHATAKRIEADVRAAMSRRLNGTPSFLVGTELYRGRLPEAELERLLGKTVQ